MKGMVKFFNGQKGYGFITPDDGGNDVFVHVSAVERSGMSTISEGQIVEFEIEPDPKTKKVRVATIRRA